MNKARQGSSLSFIKWKNLYQLGFRQLFHYLLHKLKEKSGLYRLLTPIQSCYPVIHQHLIQFPIRLPEREILLPYLENQVDLLDEAERILSGKMRYFGGDVLDFSFEHESTQTHWSLYKPPAGTDIKFIWEAGRFGWVYTLCRAYLLTTNPVYISGFLNLTRQFANFNPPNCGTHWVSAQEVGLRLIALLFAFQVFDHSLTEPDRQFITGMIITHAQRIPPTLDYALAQDNNHLLSEALALYYAGVSLPTYPHAINWRKMGWKWLTNGLIRQIDENGEYCQYSTNYHRLMLQIAVLASTIASSQGDTFPPLVLDKLRLATEWLISHLDPISGRVPNLGHNDGAYIFPLSNGEYQDYRPICQAAALAFLKKRVLPPGPWDEMAVWLNLELNLPLLNINQIQSQGVHKITRPHGWTAIRAVNYHFRPAHADQLHVDIWWKGFNIALDPGTYSYNYPSPWDNALATTAVHNTLFLENTDQMTRAGRFLWLDWKQAYIIEKKPERISAVLEKYDHIPVQHRRTIQWESDNQLTVIDNLLPLTPRFLRDISVRLQWMIPDWEIKQINHQFMIQSPVGLTLLTIDSPSIENREKKLLLYTFRGEDRFRPDDVSITIGWASPTYGVKYPIRVIHAKINTCLPFQIISSWEFPK